jgi:hypothetical protein
MTPVLHDEGEIGRFLKTLVAAFEETELLYTVVLDNGRCDYSTSSTAATPALEVNQTVTSNAYDIR